MGEAKRRQSALQTQAAQAMAVDTPGGCIHVQWDHVAHATSNARLAFFAEFLCATGVYETWVKSCPLAYTSPKPPTKQDVLGTWHLAASHTGREQPLCPHHRVARGRCQPADFGHEQNHQRRRSAPRTHSPERRAKPRLVGAPALGQHASRAEHALDTGHRHHHPSPRTANKLARRLATTPTSPVVTATPCAPTGWPICGWRSMLSSFPAKCIARARRARAS